MEDFIIKPILRKEPDSIIIDRPVPLKQPKD